MPETAPKDDSLKRLAAAGQEEVRLVNAIDELVKKEGYATRKALTAKLGLELHQVTYQIKKLQAAGKIEVIPGDNPTSSVKIVFPKPKGGVTAPEKAISLGRETMPGITKPASPEIKPGASMPETPKPKERELYTLVPNLKGA